MPLAKHYDPKIVEPRLQDWWQETGIYHYQAGRPGQVFSIDTPPPTVSGHLHLGHVYSYSHPDFIARFQRMRGCNVFYPMGYDDNGLPTERLVEKRLGITAQEVGRRAFIEKCLEVSEQAERDYQALWQRLGLSVDWRYTYRTIDDLSRRTSQMSFIDLYRRGLIYRREAPAIWCPECQTAIAQAELNDLERESEFINLPFPLEGEPGELAIATTRPELLPACVAIFVHPNDPRYKHLAGRRARVPLFGQTVPILEDSAADPEKGTGAVMCCTFGDTTDVAWWRAHHLPLIEAIDRQGRLTAAAGDFAGLRVPAARKAIKERLEQESLVLARRPTPQSIRVHERCDTPVEYVIAPQWFVRLLDAKQTLLDAGDQIAWHPEHMRSRYRAWVENLSWDWGISRQRYFGVPFPVWYCRACGQVVLAEEDQLPVDPLEGQAAQPCPNCGGTDFDPDQDVMDTWATSSLSPQIIGRWLTDFEFYRQVFPFSLRPQAHEIIRTWAFYTIAKSHYHFDARPWKDALISGWGIAGEGMPKLSKSRGGGPLPPLEMIERYSADAVRYWTSSTGPGKDSVISEQKIQLGAKLITKLWNVARFSERFISNRHPDLPDPLDPALTTADRWILSRTQRLVRRVTRLFMDYDYATAKSEIETFFWTEFADNYLEMAKQRLYTQDHPQREGARAALHHVFLTLLKLFAPLLPYITEEIYQGLFAQAGQIDSIHASSWPDPLPGFEDPQVEQVGEMMVSVATAVRRYKSEHNLSLGSDVNRLQLATTDPELAQALVVAIPDLASITRAKQVDVAEDLAPDLELILTGSALQASISPPGES